MRQKSFEAIANILKDQRDAIAASIPEGVRLHPNSPGLSAQVERIHASTCKAMASVLALQNPRFKREKFLSLCGVKQA